MNDQNIEDTRQPPEPPRYSPCDRCGADRDTDDLIVIKGAGKYGDDLYLCEDCNDDYIEEEE